MSIHVLKYGNKAGMKKTKEGYHTSIALSLYTMKCECHVFSIISPSSQHCVTLLERRQSVYNDHVFNSLVIRAFWHVKWMQTYSRFMLKTDTSILMFITLVYMYFALSTWLNSNVLYATLYIWQYMVYLANVPLEEGEPGSLYILMAYLLPQRMP